VLFQKVEVANLDLVSKIKNELKIPVQVGGGFRDMSSIEKAMALGARVITASYYEIKEKGEAGIQPYAAFTEQLKKALIERKVRLLGNLERHSETHWVVSAWRLERMFPEEFAKRVEHTGAGGGPIEGDLTVKWPELPAEPANPDKE
jgi:phosphoribosylformimino-5-aminoimidazole carboxamide ribonucleotide (ProFAR) isomerase